jgi:hypothetical protein
MFPLSVPPLRREPITRLRGPAYGPQPTASAVPSGSFRYTPPVQEQSACHSSLCKTPIQRRRETTIF